MRLQSPISTISLLLFVSLCAANTDNDSFEDNDESFYDSRGKYISKIYIICVYEN